MGVRVRTTERMEVQWQQNKNKNKNKNNNNTNFNTNNSSHLSLSPLRAGRIGRDLIVVVFEIVPHGPRVRALPSLQHSKHSKPRHRVCVCVRAFCRFPCISKAKQAMRARARRG